MHKKIDLDTFIPINNFVLVRPYIDEYNKIQLANGSFIYLVTDIEKEFNAPVLCEIIKIPERLDFKKLGYKTEIDVKPGDEVICYYLAIINAAEVGMGRKIVIDEVIYYLVSYENFVLRKRNNEIKMLNGNFLVTRKKEEQKTKIFKVNLPGMKKNKSTIVNIEEVPDKVEYFKKDQNFPTNLKKNDKIYINMYADLPLEYKYHKKINKEDDREFFRVRADNIIGKMNT